MIIRRLLFLLWPILSFGQIPNASFENWTNNIPDGWLVNISPPLLLPVTKSNDAHTGNYAIKGEVINDLGIPFGPFIQPVSTGLGFPVTQNDTMVYGFYKADLLGNNLGLVEVWLYDSLFNQVGSGFCFLTSTNNYTEFSIPLNYQQGSHAREMSIIIQMTDTDSTSHFNVGSYFIIDDLSFQHTSTVGLDPLPVKHYSVGPNPANSYIYVKGEFNDRPRQLVYIFDVTGKKIFSQALKPESDDMLTIPLDNFLTGNYIMLITDGKNSASEKISIIR